MKILILLSVVLAFSSCDKLKKFEDGMQATRDGIKNTGEGLRKSTMSEALKQMTDENNRKQQVPIPTNMMSASRALAMAINSEEMLQFVKIYLTKVNQSTFADSHPLASEPSEPARPVQPTKPVLPSEPVAPVAPTPDADGNVSPEDEAKYKDEMEKYKVAYAEWLEASKNAVRDEQRYKEELQRYEFDLVEYYNQMREYRSLFADYQNLYVKFMLNKAADLQMLTLVSGFLPDSTLQEMISSQSQQGAYRDILFAILKMRSNFHSDLMLEASLIGGDNKLETIGQIEKAIEYAEKLDFICKLEFLSEIRMKITGFSEEQNESLSAPLDKELALKKWKKILEKAEKDFKAKSFSKDPLTNENEVKLFAQQHQQALAKIKDKLAAYK